jgi:hypothetical protein
MYEDVIAFLIENEDPNEASNEREKLDNENLKALPDEFPNIPEEYFLFLKEVGWGAFLDCTYAIYSGPIKLTSVFGEGMASLDEEICLWGDGFGGNPAGFKKKTGEVVEIDHVSGRVEKTGQTFGQFIRETFGM